MKLLIATTNKGKAREIVESTSSFNIEFITPDEKLEVIEDGATYYDNALIKAAAYSKHFNMPAIADDSGLEVEGLNWGPGLYSARFGGEGLTDKERYELLLSKLAGKESAARFCCSIVIVCDGEVLCSANSSMPGKVLTKPVGENGFGYDPVFEVEGLGLTLAQIDFQKNLEIGFRAKAVREVCSKFCPEK